MEYNEILRFALLIILFVLSVLSILKSKLQIIVESDINNNDIYIKLNIKYLFNLINIKKQIYPLKNKKKSNKKSNNKKNNKEGVTNNHLFSVKDLLKIYKLIRKIEIYEIYSKLGVGTNNIEVTSFLYVFINSIYGFVASYINPQKMYLVITPNFIENKILGKVRINIRFSVKNLIYIIVEILKIIIKNKINSKRGKSNESYRVDTESNGNNA